MEDIISDILDTLYGIKDELQDSLASLDFNLDCLRSLKQIVNTKSQNKSLKIKLFELLGKKEIKNSNDSSIDYAKEIEIKKIEYEKALEEFDVVKKDIENIKNIDLNNFTKEDLKIVEDIIKRYNFPISWMNEFDRLYISNISLGVNLSEDLSEILTLSENHAFHKKFPKPSEETYNIAIDFLIIALKRYYDNYYNTTFVLRTFEDFDHRIRIDLDHISSLCGVKCFPIREEKTFMNDVLDGESHNYRMLLTIIRKRDLVVKELLKREDSLINPYSIIIACYNFLNLPVFADTVFIQGSSSKNWNTCHDFLVGKGGYIISLAKERDLYYVNNLYICKKGVSSDITVSSKIFIPELMEVLSNGKNVDVFTCDAAKRNQERIVKKLIKNL